MGHWMGKIYMDMAAIDYAQWYLILDTKCSLGATINVGHNGKASNLSSHEI